MMGLQSTLFGRFQMLGISANTSFGPQTSLSMMSVTLEFVRRRSASCGCIVIDKQWIDEDKNPIELTLNAALYGLGGNSDSFGPGDTPQLIQPGIELFVTVTVHDVQGNVYTDDLLSASVVPINNFEDTTLRLDWKM